MRQIILIALFTACTPTPIAEPIDAPVIIPPTPVATPVPTPQPVFIVPPVIPARGSLTIYLCQPYQPNTKVYIDGTLLGTMANDVFTDCMKLFYPSINTSGLRTVTVREYTAQINVLK